MAGAVRTRRDSVLDARRDGSARAARGLDPAARLLSEQRSRHLHQFRHSYDVECRAHKVPGVLRSLAAFEASSSEVADGLRPAEDLLDELPHPLAYRIARLRSGATVDRRPPPWVLVLGDMERDPTLAAFLDEIARVVALVGSHGDSLGPSQRIVEHLERGESLGAAVCLGDATIDEKTVSIFHKRVTGIRQTRGGAVALPGQAGFRIGRRFVRLVAPLLAVEV